MGAAVIACADVAIAKTKPAMAINLIIDELLAAEIDVAFMLAPWESPEVQQLLADERIALFGFSHAGALVALYPFLSPVVVPKGVWLASRHACVSARRSHSRSARHRWVFGCVPDGAYRGARRGGSLEAGPLYGARPPWRLRNGA